MNSSSAFKNIIRISVGSIIGLYILMITLLNIPFIQERLSHVVAQELSNKLNTEVKVGNIDIGLLNRIIIRDLSVKDLKGKRVLKVADLSAKFNIAPLFEGKVVISSVQVFDFYLSVDKKDKEAPTNIQFIIDAFASKDKQKSESRIDLRINSLLIRNGNLRYDVLSEVETPHKFNVSHIDIKDLTGIISLKALNNDSLNARVRRLSFTEKSGIDLKRFSFRVVGNNRKLSISNTEIELPASFIRFNNIVFRYKSLKSLSTFAPDVKYSGNLIASIIPNDISAFVPALDNYYDKFDLNIRVSGNNDEIVLSRFNMTDRFGMEINGEAFLKGFRSGMNTDVSLTLFNSNLTNRNIDNIVSSFKIPLPAPIIDRQFINFKGEVNGKLNNLSIDGKLVSDLGQIDTEVLMTTNTQGIRSYSGKVECNQFSISKLLKSEEFGDADFNVDIKGFSYKDKYPESLIKGNINSIVFKGYKYSNIALDGKFKNGGFNGKMAMSDPNGDIEINGDITLGDKLPEINVVTKVRNFSPYNLNLTKRYKESDLSFNMTAAFTGNSIDNINGSISIDSLALNAPENGSYFLDHISLDAQHNGIKKDLHISSSFINGDISGFYNYQSLPSSIVNSISKYLPSVIGNKKDVASHNALNFDMRISDGEFFEKMLFIPIELDKPVNIKGYINDDENRLKVEAYLPAVKYNNTVYDSGVIQCENKGDKFVCDIHGGMLLNSGVMLNLSMKASAKDDIVNSILNWGNNSANTYGGRFITRTHFSKTEKNNGLCTDIDILPSKVILNDSVWNIHNSSVSINNGDIKIHDFVFEHKDQHLIINGEMTKDNEDSCNVDLKNINLQYLLDIVQFDDVKFSGMITGNVIVKDIMKKPDMYAKLDVQDFALNDALLGRADIKAVWDKEKKNIDLDAKIKDNDKYTNVTGFVSPTRSDLDLHINAGGTNLALLSPFVDGIFSDIRGGAYGNVRLFGDFKHLDFEGDIKANLEARVDVLNTYFRIMNDSVHITPGEFAFNKVNVEDREGNKGVVTGYLRHQKLKKLMYHFNVDGNNLLMYNTVQNSSFPFYGKVYGTGNVVIDGGNNAMNIEASIRTARNTTFTYLTSMPNEATSNQFITFVDRTPKRIQDEIQTNLYHPMNKVKKKEDDGPEMDLRIHMIIEATPEANMKIVMDPIAGDNITATGNGNLQVNYYNKGDFRIFGNYVIDKGLYKLSMQEVIRKDFTLKSGGTVAFTGDPYQANLNVQAVYTVNSASLSDLGMDAATAQGGQSTVKVNCIMNLNGSISGPTIKFDLELPNVNEEDKELVRSATSTEEQMNTQIIYLLGIGKFYTYDYANSANSQSSNATSSLAFSTLSGQLNNMLSQLMENKNWNIGANLSTGEKGWTDVEAEAILSGSLLNNRLLINGNFGYKDNVMANTNFIGDFEAIWLLTKEGDWRLRGYNQTNNKYYLKSTLTTQGIGIMYKKEFNRWNDLFKWALWWKKPSKKNE